MLTKEQLTKDIVEQLLAEYDKNFTTIAQLFESITGLQLGRCMSCREEAAQVLRNYVAQVDRF